MDKAFFIDFGATPEDQQRADLSGRERDKLFVSKGGKGFAEVSYLSGADSVEDGRAFARVDLDRDGYEDAVVINRNAPILKIFLNREGPKEGGSFVGLELEGNGPSAVGPRQRRSTRDATGARVTVKCGAKRIVAEQVLGSGVGVVNSRVMTLGLGRCETIDSLEVKFPSGVVVRGTALAARRRYRAVESRGIAEVAGIYGGSRPVAPTAPPPPEASGPDLLAAVGPTEKPLVLVELWATWCESCLRQRPGLDRLAARFGDRIAVVGASMEPKDDAAAVAAYLQRHPSSHPLRPYSAVATKAAETIFGGAILATPSVLVLDAKSGRVELATPGLPSESDLERVLWRRGL